MLLWPPCFCQGEKREDTYLLTERGLAALTTYIAFNWNVSLSSESHPICNSSHLNESLTEGDAIQMQCIVTFRGHWKPVMIWNKSNGQLVGDFVQVISTNDSLTSTLSLNATSDLDGVTTNCTLAWSLEHRPEAVNCSNIIPEFNFSWTSERIHVMSEFLLFLVSEKLSI